MQESETHARIKKNKFYSCVFGIHLVFIPHHSKRMAKKSEKTDGKKITTITLPKPTHEALKKAAWKNLRSVSGQAESYIVSGLEKEGSI